MAENKEYYQQGRAPIELGLFYPLDTHISETLDANVYTPTIPTRVKLVVVQAIDQNIKYTLDGTNPTSVAGFLIPKDQHPITIPISNATTLKFIRVASGAILELQFGE